MFTTVLLNSTNIVKNGNNNRLVYTFPQAKQFKDNSIVLDGLALYYSWFNISAKYGNNQLQYTWPNSTGNGYTTHGITIPDGFYDAKELDAFIKSVFISNRHYVTHSLTNKNNFFLEIVENSNFYSIQMNSYAVNQAYLTSQSWVIPAGATWTVGAAVLQPQFVIGPNAFRDIVGFATGSYPPINAPATGNKYSSLSSVCPQVSPVNSLIIRCNLVSSDYSIPNDVLTSFHINAGWGEIISFNPSNANPIKIRDGIYSSIELTICDQNFNDITIIDPSMVIRLLIG
jgi:hypothetical protein